MIDYKSGSITNKGRPVDVENGTDLQLAVYLLVVEEVLGMTPFGALYAPVLPRPATKAGRDGTNPLDIKLTGLVPIEEWARVAGDLKLIRGSQPPLKTRRELDALLEGVRETLALYGRSILAGWDCTFRPRGRARGTRRIRTESARSSSMGRHQSARRGSSARRARGSPERPPAGRRVPGVSSREVGSRGST